MMTQLGDAVRHRLFGDHNVAPHLLVQCVSRHDFAGALREADQHVHDSWLDTHLGVVPRDTVLAGLDQVLTEAESRIQLLTCK